LCPFGQGITHVVVHLAIFLSFTASFLDTRAKGSKEGNGWRKDRI